MLYVNDGTEFSIGAKKSGIVIRYRGNIHGVMVLIRNHEISWFSYKRIQSLSWNNAIRLPFRKRAITF